VLRALLALGLVMLSGYQGAQADATQGGVASLAAATRSLDHARAEAASGCTSASDVLVRVLCDRRLRVGLRTYYPGFAVRNESGAFIGFEPDIGRRIAAFLGVPFVPVAVDAKSRIPLLADRQIDLVIATMGHTVPRSTEVRFIRPHYYESQTAIVGAKPSEVTGWASLAGRTVCLPLGSSTNLEFVRRHVHIRTFDHPEQLLDALRFDQCPFIVQDDTFFAEALATPAFADQFGIKFRFGPVPWGMAVARDGATQFATLLDELSVAFHADGVFLDLARAHQLDPTFLTAEHDKWAGTACLTADGAPRESCLTPPAETVDAADPSPIAAAAAWLQRKLDDWFGVTVDLSLLRNQSTFELLLAGIAYTLVLIIGTQLTTTVCALGFGWLMISGAQSIRRGVGAVTAVGQVTPLPLLMFFVYVVAGGIAHFSDPVALLAAVFAIGLYNGSNAAHAIDEAHRILQRRDTQIGVPPTSGNRPAFVRALTLASVQLVAFLINAAKGSPAAGMIGVPDFLNVVTDLTASMSGRATVYLVLLVFYVSLISAVIVLLTVLRSRLIRRTAGQW
jgi:ABC-type amino acid transport substrate-binding protein/ABC-type amino acid transport system permease subunit